MKDGEKVETQRSGKLGETRVSYTVCDRKFGRALTIVDEINLIKERREHLAQLLADLDKEFLTIQSAVGVTTTR